MPRLLRGIFVLINHGLYLWSFLKTKIKIMIFQSEAKVMYSFPFLFSNFGHTFI